MESASDTTACQRQAPQWSINANTTEPQSFLYIWDFSCKGFLVCWVLSCSICTQAAFPLGELVLGSSKEGYWVDENIPDGIDYTSATFMLHVPDRARGGYPLQAPNVASKKQWMKVLNEVIDSTRPTPKVMTSLPHSYDNDMETLRRVSTSSEHLDPGASSVVVVEHRDSTASESSNWYVLKSHYVDIYCVSCFTWQSILFVVGIVCDIDSMGAPH